MAQKKKKEKSYVDQLSDKAGKLFDNAASAGMLGSRRKLVEEVKKKKKRGY